MTDTHLNDAIGSSAPRKITCPQYDPLPGKRHCKHFIQGGTCALPDQFLCVEWAAVNGHRGARATHGVASGEATLGMAGRGEAGPAKARQGTAPVAVAHDERRSTGDSSPRSQPRDLFGNPVPPPPASSKPKVADPLSPPQPVAAASEPEAPEARPALRGLTTEDIASFKALGVEVCLRSEAYGELWLVPAYTGHLRKEITPEHVATIAQVVDTFPGSRVTAFDRPVAPEGSLA